MIDDISRIKCTNPATNTNPTTNTNKTRKAKASCHSITGVRSPVGQVREWRGAWMDRALASKYRYKYEEITTNTSTNTNIDITTNINTNENTITNAKSSVGK